MKWREGFRRGGGGERRGECVEGEGEGKERVKWRGGFRRGGGGERV